MTGREALDAAYRATTYRVGRHSLRIGEAHPWLDHLLANRGLVHYAYLTAANPGSRALAPAENARRMRALEEELAGFVLLRGAAHADDGSWEPEPSLLVLGLSPDDATEIARRYGQNAILVGTRGSSPQLVWL